MKTNYTVGFLFNKSMTRVALIKKNRPDWQRGKLNGVGGHIEPGESPTDCIDREFDEEVSYHPDDTGKNEEVKWTCQY